MLTREKINVTQVKMRRRLVLHVDHDNLKDCAFKISLNSVRRDRGDESRPVIIAELKQMMNKQYMPY
jgi:hypothetical protein